MQTPHFGGFTCSQAHNFLTSDQRDPEDNFSPIKKFNILTHFDATPPLNHKLFFIKLNLGGSARLFVIAYLGNTTPVATT